MFFHNLPFKDNYSMCQIVDFHKTEVDCMSLCSFRLQSKHKYMEHFTIFSKRIMVLIGKASF